MLPDIMLPASIIICMMFGGLFAYFIFRHFQTNFDELRTTVNQQDIKINDLQSEREVAQAEREVAQAARTKLKKKMRHQDSHISQLDSTVAKQRLKITTQDSTIKKQDSFIADLTTKVGQQQFKFDNQDTRLQDSKSQIEKLDSVVEKQQSCIDELKTTIGDYQDLMASLQVRDLFTYFRENVVLKIVYPLLTNAPLIDERTPYASVLKTIKEALDKNNQTLIDHFSLKGILPVDFMKLCRYAHSKALIANGKIHKLKEQLQINLPLKSEVSLAAVKLYTDLLKCPFERSQCHRIHAVIVKYHEC